MTDHVRYTPLESVLLFQALRAHDLAAIDFAQVSNDLLALPLLKHEPSHDIARLAPQALELLYNNLINEQLARDQDAFSDTQTSSPLTRKRKATSQSLPTVRDASVDARLLPKLLLRLYTAFRDSCVQDVKREEAEYARLSDEIGSIQRGEWNARFQVQVDAANAAAAEQAKLARKASIPIPKPIQTAVPAPPRNAPLPLSKPIMEAQTRSPIVPQSGIPRLPPSSPHIPFAQSAASTPANPQIVQSILAGLRQRRATSKAPDTPLNLRQRRGTWKSTDTPLNLRPPSPTRPEIEPLSPIRSTALPARTTAPTTSSPARPILPPVDTSPISERRTRASRSTVNTSPVAPPTTRRNASRSQSVASVAQSQSLPTAVSSEPFKDEPATPAPMQEDDHTAVASPSTRRTRARRGTVQSPVVELPAPSGRQPRSSSPARNVPQSSPPRQPKQASPRNDMIYATRNFQRISAVILNAISAHRHAGTFQKPVSAKDVEGYGDMIRRPQDLRSIKSLVTAGNKAVTAALQAPHTSDDASPRATTPLSKESNVVALERSADLMPPRAIVNSAQLEKEIMRVFANAVMFTPGNDGIVRDAREMAEDVDGIIQNWRNVKRAAGDEEDEGMPAVGADAQIGRGGADGEKRKRV